MMFDENRARQTFNALRNGNPQALGSLFENYYSILYNYCFTICHDAELTKDCIQELFIYLWEKQENLSEVKSVRAYLLTSLRRLVFKNLDKRKTELERNTEIKNDQLSVVFSAEDLIIFQEIDEQRKQNLKSAVQEIPERMREALYLKTYDNFSHKEIAEVMNISYQAARNYVSEALQRLRKPSVLCQDLVSN